MNAIIMPPWPPIDPPMVAKITVRSAIKKVV
jgi:hypothetical protein